MDFVEIGSRFARGGHPRPRAWDWTLRTVIRVGGKQAGFGLQTVVSSESSVASAHTFREELGYAAIALEGISTSDLLRELSFDAALSWAEISDLLDTPMCLLGGGARTRRSGRSPQVLALVAFTPVYAANLTPGHPVHTAHVPRRQPAPEHLRQVNRRHGGFRVATPINSPVPSVTGVSLRVKVG